MSFGKATAKAIPRDQDQHHFDEREPERFKAASPIRAPCDRDNRKSRGLQIVAADENSAGRAVASHHEILASVSECIRYGGLARHVPVWRSSGGVKFSSLLPQLEGRSGRDGAVKRSGVREGGPRYGAFPSTPTFATVPPFTRLGTALMYSTSPASGAVKLLSRGRGNR